MGEEARQYALLCFFTLRRSLDSESLLEPYVPELLNVAYDRTHPPRGIAMHVLGHTIQNSLPKRSPILPLTLRQAELSGKPATLLYSGTAPFQIPGIIQVNAVVPEGLNSGPQPIVLTTGGLDNASQNATVAIQ